MSPVHVLVSEDPADEQAWAQAFAGAVDLYRFGRNAEAFERLTSAAAPIDLVVVTPNQDGPFNLSADQLVARVLETPLGRSGALAKLYFVIVGERVRSTDPRVACVSSLDAAIRLIKFGELERAPRPVVERDRQDRPDVERELARLGSFDIDLGGVADDDSMFASSVISRIWDAGDQAAVDAKRRLQRRDVRGGGGSDDRGVDRPDRSPRQRGDMARRDERDGGRTAAQAVAEEARAAAAAGQMQRAHGHRARQARTESAHDSQQAAVAAAMQANRQPDAIQLFAHEPPHPASLTAARLAQPPAPGHQAQPALAVQPHQVTGGGAAAPAMQVPGESVQVSTGASLAPVRPYHVANPGYRGPAMRGTVPNAAGHAPVPPALLQQVQSIVYPPSGAVPDPLLTWSGKGPGTVTTRAVPVPQGGAQAPAQMARPTAHPAARMQLVAAPVAMPQAPPAAQSTDPLMQRLAGEDAASFG